MTELISLADERDVLHVPEGPWLEALDEDGEADTVCGRHGLIWQAYPGGSLDDPRLCHLCRAAQNDKGPG